MVIAMLLFLIWVAESRSQWVQPRAGNGSLAAIVQEL